MCPAISDGEIVACQRQAFSQVHPFSLPLVGLWNYGPLNSRKKRNNYAQTSKLYVNQVEYMGKSHFTPRCTFCIFCLTTHIFLKSRDYFLKIDTKQVWIRRDNVNQRSKYRLHFSLLSPKSKAELLDLSELLSNSGNSLDSNQEAL